MSLAMKRGPIKGTVAVDPRDGLQYVVTGVDPSHRLPSKEAMDSTADALLKPTLDEILGRCIELGIADKDALKTTRMNVMLKKFTNKHYIQLWAERLAELDRMGLLPPIGRRLEGWEVQARDWSETDILTPQQVQERRGRALRAAFSVRASGQIKARKAASWQQPKPEPESMQPKFATGERAIAGLHRAYATAQPGLLRLEMERSYRPHSRGTLERLALKDRSAALGGDDAEAEAEAELEPEPEQPAYMIESQSRVEATRAALEAATSAALMAKRAAEELRERLSEASKKAFERVDTDKSGEIDKYELRSLCQELGIGMNVRQLKQAWGWMDRDGDGTIQLEEFDQWLL